MPYCKNCGVEYHESQELCINCGIFFKGEDEEDKGMKMLVTLLIIFVYPFGIPFMWVTGTYTLRTRWIITLAFLTMIILGFAMIIIWTASPGYMH